MPIANELTNWSYSDCSVRRVLAEPPPAVRLVAFGDNGIELELRICTASGRSARRGRDATRCDAKVATVICL